MGDSIPVTTGAFLIRKIKAKGPLGQIQGRAKD